MSEGLSHRQRNMLLKLWRMPQYTGVVHQVTGDALKVAGYVEHAGSTRLARAGRWKHHYRLTQAGIRFNQTGKEIGE